MMSKTTPIGEALRRVRQALGLRQADFAKRVLVGRETVSDWEVGRTAPSHEQRSFILSRLGDAPAEAVMPLVEAFGVVAPPGLTGAKKPGAPAERVLAAIRAAADELDVPASALRRTLTVVLAHFASAGIVLDDAAGFLSSASAVSPGQPGQRARAAERHPAKRG
jgi:transcriptional regulator with XRE-family HTH domain